MDKGWIKLWRKSKDSAVFAHEGLWKLWCLCLMKASHKHIEVSVPGILKPVKLHPGQFITGRDALHRDYHQGHLKHGISRKRKPTAITLYRWLQFLQKSGHLHIKSHNKFSIITVTNWQQYQENEQQVNNKRTSNEHKQESIENEKEVSAKKGRTKKTNPDVKRFIGFWCQQFQEKFGSKYTVTGKKEGNLVRRLLNTDPYEELTQLAERFFNTDDSFIKDAGYTIGVFSSQINKLKTQGNHWYDQHRR